MLAQHAVAVAGTTQHKSPYQLSLLSGCIFQWKHNAGMEGGVDGGVGGRKYKAVV